MIHLKAVYGAGDKLNENGGYYRQTVPVALDIPDTGVYGASEEYWLSLRHSRVNNSGYGVSFINSPALRVKAQQKGMDDVIYMPEFCKRGDDIDVDFVVPGTVMSIRYMLINLLRHRSQAGATTYTSEAAVNLITDDYSGLVDKHAMKLITDAAIKREETSDTTISASLLNKVRLKTSAGGTFNARTALNGYRAHIVACMQAERDRSGMEVPEVSYYQYQWAMISGEYLSHAEAKQKCFEGGYTWITFENGYGMEETT